MEMKTDSIFEIGSSHDVCQDFALTGKINDKIYFAIVADGCTESHKHSGEVDFGARILSYAAREALKEMLADTPNLKASKDNFAAFNKTLRDKIIESTLKVGFMLKLSDLFADATLVVAITDGNISLTFIYGDGGVIVYKRNGDIIYREVSFLSSAPYYLAYLHNKGRNDGYKIQFGASPAIVTTYVINGVNGESRQANEVYNDISEELYNHTSTVFEDFLSISVTSDGIKSYDKLGTPIPSTDLARKFISFKNQNAGFLQRRFNFMKKEQKDENVTHYDDVSVATVLL
jgi:hypothetical protein